MRRWETPRTAGNWRRIWLASSSQQTTPLRGWIIGGLWLCSINLTSDFGGGTPFHSHRTQLVCFKQTTPLYGRRNESFIFHGKPSSHGMMVTDVVHQILGMDFFQAGEGKLCIIDPRRRCFTDTMEEFPVDNKAPSVSSLMSATSAPNPCHCESGELSSANKVVGFEYVWT